MCIAFAANAQERKVDGRTRLINGNNNFQLYAAGNYQYMSGDHVAGGGAGFRYNYKRLLAGVEYQYAKIGNADRSYANAQIGVGLIGNPNIKVRPYLVAKVGGASQTAYSCYQLNIKGSGQDFNVQGDLALVHKSYNWNLQTALEFRTDFVLSSLCSLSVFVEGIYNPFEGRANWSSLENVDIEYPSDQTWVIDIKDLGDHTASNKFGVRAGLTINFRL